MSIEKELKDFQIFKETYEFKQKEIKEINGKEFCEGYPLEDENGKKIGQCEEWVNVGYGHEGAIAKVLSNLFPYEFEFRGKKLNCIESFFQGIKFKDPTMQTLVLKYSGFDANRVKVCSEYDWKLTGIVYWQGQAIDRYSKEYELLVDELYISALQNPLYRNAIKNCPVDIIHSISDQEKNNSVFTRYEFEKELNCLKEFLKDK